MNNPFSFVCFDNRKSFRMVAEGSNTTHQMLMQHQQIESEESKKQTHFITHRFNKT